MNGTTKHWDAESDELEALTDSMTREEKMQALEAAGFSRAELDGYFAEQHAKIQKAIEKQSNVVPIRKAWYRRVSWTLPAVAAGSGGFGMAATIVMQLATAASPPMQYMAPLATAAAPAPTAPQRDYADELREEAFSKCIDQEWQACLKALDDAKVIDPKEPTHAKNARDLATRELARQKQ